MGDEMLHIAGNELSRHTCIARGGGHVIVMKSSHARHYLESLAREVSYSIT